MPDREWVCREPPSSPSGTERRAGGGSRHDGVRGRGATGTAGGAGGVGGVGRATRGSAELGGRPPASLRPRPRCALRKALDIRPRTVPPPLSARRMMSRVLRGPAPHTLGSNAWRSRVLQPRPPHWGGFPRTRFHLKLKHTYVFTFLLGTGDHF